MSDMGLFDYVAMVEETPVDTHIVEYRWPKARHDTTLLACALPTCCVTACRWSTASFIPARMPAAWARK